MSALVLVQAAALQTPAVQAAPMAQVTPQPPQLLTSEAVATQAVPQRVVPVGQTGLQTLAAQEVVPPVGAVHLVPQPPQLLKSVAVAKQAVPQRVVPVGQTGLQTLAAQEVVPPVGAVHLVPQAPQLLTS